MIPNQMKTVLLISILTGLLLAIGYLVGGFNGLTIGLIISLLMNGIMFWFSDKIALWMYKAQLASEKEYHALHAMVADVARKAGIPKPRVYIIPSQNPNAFATGRSPNNAAVAFTKGIMELLTPEELKGVTAHEISHVKNRDTLITTIAAALAGIISYVGAVARWMPFLGSDDEGNNVFYFVVLGIITPLLALLIQFAISRSREFLADETGARIIHNPTGLAVALQKLEQGSKARPMQMGTEATSSLFIVNPFRGGMLLNLLSTHPPMQERVRRLKNMRF